MTIILETQRLLLRPLTEADLDDLYALYRQPDLMRYITGQPRSYTKTQERLRSHMAEYKRYGFGLCATILKANGEMIGRCGLEPVNRATGLEGNMAWMFKKAYWGQGLATEFGQAMLPYGFERLHLRRIFATADHRNVASIRVMQKLGMRLARTDDFEVEYEAYPGHNASDFAGL
jgi:ribosomal-protein-alanine N-acetyltransferase